MSAPTTSDFQRALDRNFQDAQDQQLSYVDVVSGDVHRELGGYPSSNHRMPNLCQVMRRNMHERDEILSSPPSGQGATLRIRYRLPR